MLTDDYLQECTERIQELYAELETDIIANIAYKIGHMNYFGSSVERQIYIATSIKKNREEVIKLIADKTKMSEKEIERIFKDAAMETLGYDDSIYQDAYEAGIIAAPPVDLVKSPVLMQILNAGAMQTNGTLKNFTQSMLGTSDELLRSSLDRAYFNIVNGGMEYNFAITEVVKDLSRQGITIVNYESGTKAQVDVAVKRAALTGVNQTALKLSEKRADEMGCDLVEVSSHMGAREGEGIANHLGWQGKVYSRSGQHEKYPDFVKSTGYGQGAGLGGWNCRHSFYPFFEGLSKKNPKAGTKPDITYNGKTYTYYEQTQRLRLIERQIRKWKRESIALESAGQDPTQANSKVNQWRAAAREWVSLTGIERRRFNEKVV